MWTRRKFLAAAAPAAVAISGGTATMSTMSVTEKAKKTGTTTRAIEGIYRPPGLHWVGDGFRVFGYFSAIPDAMRKLDPFLMLDYHPEYRYEPTQRPRGVGVHPHRGFETVTVAFQGSVAHHDSTGAGGVIGPGDVQWMTAASGILHKEYHEAEWARRGGPFQMAQFWVNLPRAHKMNAPRYQPIVAGQIGVARLPDGQGEVRVIAGEFEGTKGPAKTHSPVTLFHARLAERGAMAIEQPKKNNLGFVVMKGEVTLNGSTRAAAHDLVVFGNNGERVSVVAGADTELMVFGGEPIAEPISAYGPFVMNTREEIQQAFVDLEAGRFGHLDD